MTPAAYKAAAGAFAHLPVVQETNLVRSLGKLKDAGFWVAGADGRAEQTAWDAPLEGKLVLVMGAEGEGLSRLVREACDFLVRLPQAGRVDSLNVAQATAVLTYEWVRRGGRVAAPMRTLIVDGYNVIRRTPPYRQLAEDDDFDAARTALVSDVAAFAHGEWRATVVFDGHANPHSDGSCRTKCPV